MATEVKKASKFGDPVLRAGGAGSVAWSSDSTYLQKSTSGYTAELTGGAQSGDDWAALYIPVNEMYLTHFKSALWSWYQASAQTMGLGIVIWIHSPSDNDKRAELTQLANVTGLDKSTGWNSHELNLATTQFFFYGENTTGTTLTAGTQYTLAQFQADVLFSEWTIYRISFENGWEASGTFGSFWVADVNVNNEVIPLIPPSSWVNPPTVVRILHPFGKGVATAGGAQYGTLITGIATTYTAIEAAATIYNPSGYTLAELEIGMMGATDGSGTTDSIIYEVQGSDLGTSWDTISSIITRAANASALADFANVLAGRIDLAAGTNFKGTGASFQIRVVAKSGGTTDTAGGKMKNSSYIIATYRRTGG